MGHRKQVTVEDVEFYKMKTIVDDNGNLTPIESKCDIPFAVERVFYVYGVPQGDRRGCHAHRKNEQLLVCVHGTIEIICKDGEKEKSFILDSPRKGLYIPSMIWDEQVYIAKDSVLLSLCSTKYDSSDYIHNYSRYKELNNENNQNT